MLAAVSLEKDVDGFHPLNIGKLCMKGRTPLFVPCTPAGCMVLLERCNIPIKGKRAVVVGRSNIVGLPAAMLLNERDATVTIAHSRTPVRQAAYLTGSNTRFGVEGRDCTSECILAIGAEQ